MKLNVEEQNFIHRWSWNYPSALKSARKYRECRRVEYIPNKTLEDVEEDLQRYCALYASYKYWYGIMFGMIQAMSFKVRISIYGACLKALNHLEEEAYGYDKEIF